MRNDINIQIESTDESVDKTEQNTDVLFNNANPNVLKETLTADSAPKVDMSKFEGLDIAKLVAQIMVEANKINEDKNREYNERKEIEKQQHLYSQDTAGLASEKFRNEMLDLIKNHPEECVTVSYWPALAKKFGGWTCVNINGFNIGFLSGCDTLVPKPLMHAVRARFYGIIDAAAEANMGFSSPKASGGVDGAQIPEAVYNAFKANGINLK